MNNEEKINQIFKKIEKKSSTGEYIYRGEPKDYGKVSSNLFRQYQGEIENNYFNIKDVQNEILEEARKYTNLKKNLEIMTKLQHYGGKTNFIDFTKDYRIALFFACNGSYEDNGRIILKNKTNTKECKIHEPRSPKNRVISQKSIFIYSSKGFFKPKNSEIILVSSDLKLNILDYLENYHDISAVTIYNDLHGFIENEKIHDESKNKFFMGLAASRKAFASKVAVIRDRLFREAIAYYDESIQLNPRNDGPYINRGNAKVQIEEDLEGALDDYNKALEISPHSTKAYENRGIYYLKLKNYTAAIDDLTKALERQHQNASIYYNRGLAKVGLPDRTAKQDFEQALSLATAQGNTDIANLAQLSLNELKD